LPQKCYTSDRIVLTVENGYAVKIEGGVDAELLRDYMESFNDPEGYAISHIGWGLQPRCHWSTMGLYDREQSIAMDARAYEGNCWWSVRRNTGAGGNRAPAGHIDIPRRNCRVQLDGQDVGRKGKVIEN